jgi:hypothetical protein
MAVFPDLNEEERRILRIILDSKIIRGAELMRQLGTSDPTELLDPLRQLLNRNLVEITGELTPDLFPFATLGAPPSAQGYIRARVQQR